MTITYAIKSRNNTPVDYIKFPGGEIHVRNFPKNRNGHRLVLNARIETPEDIIVLLMTTDAARRQGFDIIQLSMPYVPYARQDRVANPGEAHALKMFATLVNAQKYDKVVVYDPHSDVVEALFDNIKITNNHHFVRDIVPENKPFYLVVPDAGAQKKATALCAFLMADGRFNDMEVILANKKRDTKTGQITGFVMDKQGPLNPEMPCYIIDDICDGGGTFMGLAKVLKEAGAGDQYLAVSHGIFSNNAVERLTNEYFKGIICAYSWSTVDQRNPNLKVKYKR